jgi:arsenate reductase
MADLTVFHHPAGSTSRRASERVDAVGADADVVQYLRTPPDRDALLDLMAKLEDPPADWSARTRTSSRWGSTPTTTRLPRPSPTSWSSIPV